MSSFKILESETGLQVAGLRKSFKKRIVIMMFPWNYEEVR
jgi:hypothetical protein